MRHLCIVIHIHAIAIFLRQPLASQSQPRVDPDALVRHLNRIFGRLVRYRQTFLGQGVNATRARRAEMSGKLLVTLDPFIDCRASGHSRIIANPGELFALGCAIQKLLDLIVCEALASHQL